MNKENSPMLFRTLVEVPDLGLRIDHTTELLMIGSCFSESIALRMSEGGFRVQSNPFGVLYNPFSMADGLDRLIDCAEYRTEDLMEHQGAYHNFDFHSAFSHVDPLHAVAMQNSAIRVGAEQLRQARVLILTFGSAFYYRLRGDGRVVANCHKLPAVRFERCRAEVMEIVDRYAMLLERLTEVDYILFTVSPVRHRLDGFAANNRSKAVLQLAVEAICRSDQRCSYFPSYEIVMDELRDYRFYAADMLHPSDQAIDYVYDRFARSIMDVSTFGCAERYAGFVRSLAHRPLIVRPEVQLDFLERQLGLLYAFAAEYPKVDCQRLIECYGERIAMFQP